MKPYAGKTRNPRGTNSLTHKCPTRERSLRTDKRRARREGKDDIGMDLLVRSMARDNYILILHHD